MLSLLLLIPLGCIILMNLPFLKFMRKASLGVVLLISLLQTVLAVSISLNPQPAGTDILQKILPLGLSADSFSGLLLINIALVGFAGAMAAFATIKDMRHPVQVRQPRARRLHRPERDRAALRSLLSLRVPGNHRGLFLHPHRHQPRRGIHGRGFQIHHAFRHRHGDDPVGRRGDTHDRRLDVLSRGQGGPGGDKEPAGIPRCHNRPVVRPVHKGGAGPLPLVAA